MTDDFRTILYLWIVFVTGLVAIIGFVMLALHDVFWQALPLLLYSVWAQFWLGTRKVER